MYTVGERGTRQLKGVCMFTNTRISRYFVNFHNKYVLGYSRAENKPSANKFCKTKVFIVNFHDKLRFFLSSVPSYRVYNFYSRSPCHRVVVSFDGTHRFAGVIK